MKKMYRNVLFQLAFKKKTLLQHTWVLKDIRGKVWNNGRPIHFKVRQSGIFCWKSLHINNVDLSCFTIFCTNFNFNCCNSTFFYWNLFRTTTSLNKNKTQITWQDLNVQCLRLCKKTNLLMLPSQGHSRIFKDIMWPSPTLPLCVKPLNCRLLTDLICSRWSCLICCKAF